MSVHVVFINATTGYPRKFSAGNTKVEFMARGLLAQGASVTVINMPTGEPEFSNIQDVTSDGIRHISFPQQRGKYLSLSINMFSLIGLLKQIRVAGAKNILINDFSFITTFLYHVALARMWGYKIVPLFHEWHVSFPHKGIRGWSNRMIDKHFGRFSDGILPISQFLEQQSVGFGKPMLKVPILADFQSIQNLPQKIDRSFFLYCGHSRYFRLIRVIVEGYRLFASSGGSQGLTLVMGGDTRDVDKVRNYVAQQGLETKVKILTQVPYAELIAVYQQALALLIPLDPANMQDNARFSQKIAEYLSVGRPLITVNVGEVSLYFVDKQNAFIAQDFTAEQFRIQMQYVADHQELADEVGSSGYIMGEREFDYRRNGKKLYDFISQL